jgi:hypothetical protein
MQPVLSQLAIGGIVSLLNIGIHALAMTGVLQVLKYNRRREARYLLGKLAGLMIGVVAVLTLTHVVHVLVWSVTYSLVGALPQLTASFYFAFVNFTTLGYGDILPTPDWRLLGPMTAMNGVLLLGWSTAVIFAALSSSSEFREY